MFKKSLIAAAALSLVAGASQAQLVNGDFESSTPSAGFPAYTQYTNGQTLGVGSGWTVIGTTNGVRVVQDSEFTNINGSDRQLFDSQLSTPVGQGKWIDLTGLSDQNTGANALGMGITQTFGGLVVGQTYRLSFDVGVVSAFNHPASVTVSGNTFGAQTFTNSDVVSDPNGLLGQTWKSFSLDFVAAASNTIQFVGAPNTSPTPSQFLSIGLDNVVVTQVPEPSAYAMMLAGFGVLGFAARRKRKSA